MRVDLSALRSDASLVTRGGEPHDLLEVSVKGTELLVAAKHACRGDLFSAADHLCRLLHAAGVEKTVKGYARDTLK